jgi:hypothetical protein
MTHTLCVRDETEELKVNLLKCLKDSVSKEMEH